MGLKKIKNNVDTDTTFGWCSGTLFRGCGFIQVAARTELLNLNSLYLLQLLQTNRLPLYTMQRLG